MKNQLYDFLFKSIHPSIVSLFRIIFGSFMIYQMFYYFKIDYTYQFMAGPQVLFPYYGFSFLKPLPLAILKSIHFGLLLSAILITIGFWYRYAITFFFFGFSYFSFIDKTLFNNHIYLITLLSFVMIFIEADKTYSMKARRSIKRDQDFIPAWNQYILIFLISLPYFFGGIAKLSSNWLNTDLTKIILTESKGSFLYKVLPENIFLNLITYGGIIYDLLIVFLLLNKRTRKIGILLLVIFNLTNGNLFFNDIGLFPYLMICSTILFFDASKIGKFMSFLFPKKTSPNLGKLANKKRIQQLNEESSQIMGVSAKIPIWSFNKKITALCIILFVVFHLVFPLRHFILTNNPEWTGIGSRFSWRMKMQTREITNFNMAFINRTNGDNVEIDAASFLSKNQLTHIIEDPYNFIHLAKYLLPLIEKQYKIKNPKITADIKVRFNGLQTQNMISPYADLVNLNENPFIENSWTPPLKKTTK